VYIQFDKKSSGSVHKVIQFTEKPDKTTAEKFIASGNYLWNAGIFIWKSRDILYAFTQNANDVLAPLKGGEDKINTPEETAFIKNTYPNTPKISIDYAIMEKADNVYTIPSDIAWSDLGTWTSVFEEREKDNNGNVTDGKTLLTDTHNSLIRMPNGKLAVIRGIQDFIIVDDHDVLLIWPKNDEQAIKQVRENIDPEFL
jgi:mannose-1-phosphate guanylyltransferase